jgi:hypothetical protein
MFAYCSAIHQVGILDLEKVVAPDPQVLSNPASAGIVTLLLIQLVDATFFLVAL